MSEVITVEIMLLYKKQQSLVVLIKVVVVSHGVVLVWLKEIVIWLTLVIK